MLQKSTHITRLDMVFKQIAANYKYKYKYYKNPPISLDLTLYSSKLLLITNTVGAQPINLIQSRSEFRLCLEIHSIHFQSDCNHHNHYDHKCEGVSALTVRLNHLQPFI